MRKPRRSILPVLLVTLLFLFICLIAGGAAWSYFMLPNLVEQSFGPPIAHFSPLERITYSARLFVERRDILTPVDEGGSPVPFKVELGESVPSVALHLEQAGLVRSASAFRLYLVYAGLDTGIQAGEYQLSPALNSIQIARALQDATPTEVSFSILPGWRAEEIADALPTSGLKVTKKEFLQIVNDPSQVDLPADWPNLDSLEGFLYPDVYRLKRDITAKEIVQTFLNRFDERVDQDIRQGLEHQGYDLFQGVILASLVQREAMVAEEQPMIASVFLNRMKDGMKLDSDPTVQYALGYNSAQKTWWTNPLSSDDLAFASPYNTYQNTGLPPGPICSPTLSAIRAVAFPAQTPYYYFRARCDNSGRHSFAKTYQEQLQNACP